jgi:hypothetical protein
MLHRIREMLPIHAIGRDHYGDRCGHRSNHCRLKLDNLGAGMAFGGQMAT